MDKYQVEVYNALCRLGIPAHIKGYQYIKSAMTYIREHPESIYAVTKELYPAVAAMHGEDVEWENVERGIRNAIDKIRVDNETQCMILGRSGHMCNSEFLATLTESIKIKLEEVEG